MNCLYCGDKLTQLQIKALRKKAKNSGKVFCSLSCSTSYRLIIKSEERRTLYESNPTKCAECNNPINYETFRKRCSDRTKNKNKKKISGNMFCNKSCSAKFNNKGKNRHSVSSEKTINNIMDLSLKIVRIY